MLDAPILIHNEKPKSCNRISFVWASFWYRFVVNISTQTMHERMTKVENNTKVISRKIVPRYNLQLNRTATTVKTSNHFEPISPEYRWMYHEPRNKLIRLNPAHAIAATTATNGKTKQKNTSNSLLIDLVYLTCSNRIELWSRKECPFTFWCSYVTNLKNSSCCLQIRWCVPTRYENTYDKGECCEQQSLMCM